MSRGMGLFMDVGTKEGRDRDAAVSLLFFFPPRRRGSSLPARLTTSRVLNKRHLRDPSPPPPMEKAVLGARTRYLLMRRNLSDIKRSVRQRYHYYKKLNKIIATNSASLLDAALQIFLYCL